MWGAPFADRRKAEGLPETAPSCQSRRGGRGVTGCTTCIRFSTPTTSTGSPRGDPSANPAPEAPSRALSLKDLHSPGQGGQARWAPRPASGGGGIASWQRGFAASNVPSSGGDGNAPQLNQAPPRGPGLRVLVGSLLPRISRGTTSRGSSLRVRLTDICSGGDCGKRGRLLPAPERRPALRGQKPRAGPGLSREPEAKSCPAVEGLPWVGLGPQADPPDQRSPAPP